MNCIMKKSESEHLQMKKFSPVIKRSQTLDIDNAQQLIPLETLGSRTDENGNDLDAKKKGSSKFADAFRSVFDSMRSIKLFSKSPSFSSSKKTDSNVSYDRLSTTEDEWQQHQTTENRPEDGNGNFKLTSGSGNNSCDQSAKTNNQLSKTIDFYDCLSQGSWDDEDVTCNVCDRAFLTPWHLERHQQKKRHWGCDICDTLFPSFMLLEHHKEEYEHWSDDDFEDDEEDYYLDDDDDDYDFENHICSCNETFDDSQLEEIEEDAMMLL